MKLLPKVHKLHHPASTDNLAQLTGRPIITAHSWITSKPSRLLGEELDKLLFQIHDIFKNRQIKFPLVNNSFDLLTELQNIRINDIDKYTLTTFDFTSLYTNISYPDAIHAIIDACKLLNKPTSYRDLLLNLNHFVNNNNFFVSGCTTFQQVKGVAMGSYSRQIADLVLLLSEFKFLTANNTTDLFIFRRYIDDGFMLTSKTSTNTLVTALASSYPTQIPISFTSSQHFVHYLELCISLNYYTILHHKVHYQVFQKPRHKYMYPHFSSNHPQHVFTGIIKTETFRYSRLSATKNDYDFVRKIFFFRLTNLDYPAKLLTDNSFPWLPLQIHKERKKHRNTSSTTHCHSTIYYHSKYNKHIRTDKIVQKILHKYHNIHLPKLSKAYCNSTKLHTLLLTNKIMHSKLSSSSKSK